MGIRPICTKADHDAALRDIGMLIEAKPKRGTREFDRLDALVSVVNAYEETHHPIAPPDPSGSND